MKRPRPEGPSRKLIDHVTGAPDLGPARALIATTFDLNPEFVEIDFLPSLLGVPAWDDRRIKSRVQLEAALARMEAVALLMDARRYQGRPRSLRVHVTPAVATQHGLLHAKVTVVVHDDAIRLLVGSANLTTSGYRENREVAVALVVDRKRKDHGALVRQALAAMPTLLQAWWSPDAEQVAARALTMLDAWGAPDTSDDEWFVWGGGEVPLWRQVVARWPEGEAVKRIRIVSPFWSDEGDDGQLARLLTGLRERGATVKGADVLLITAATPDTTHTSRPTLPPSYGTFDFRRLGVDVAAVPAKPQVDEEDVGRDDVLRERALHAKVVLIEGPKTSLAYAGSGNFTVPGWGFGRTAGANLEAGLLLRRTGKERAALEALLPPTTGMPVALRGGGTAVLVSPEPEADAALWPGFLHRVELRPDAQDSERLELFVELTEETVPERWSLALDPTSAARLDGTSGGARERTVPLTPDEVNTLLRRQSVSVRWEGMKGDEPVQFPVNVSMSARGKLPFGDPDALPSEDQLVAFYQGRIAFEDLFPEPNETDATTGLPIAGAFETSVDTSRILSYQVRSFVEALPGLRDELERNTATEGTIRLALLGPVSPVALAKEIEKAANKGRSPTAAGFQLTELMASLRSAARLPVHARVKDAWARALGEAEGEVGGALLRLREGRAELAPATSFGRYVDAVLPATVVTEKKR